MHVEKTIFSYSLLRSSPTSWFCTNSDPAPHLRAFIYGSLSPTCRYYPLFQSQPFSPPVHSRTRCRSACTITLIHLTPHHSSFNHQLLTHRDPPQHLSQQFNTSFMLTIQPPPRLMILSTSHIRHHASHITHHTSRVVSSSRNVLSYHHHQLTSQSSLLSASPSPSVSTS